MGPLSIEEEHMESLGIKSPKVGQKVKLRGEGHVLSAGKGITVMLTKAKSKRSAGSKLYDKSGKAQVDAGSGE